MMVAHEQLCALDLDLEQLEIDEVAQEELGLTFKCDEGSRDRNKVGML